jgi:tetratricopeptide (TPR) repeat protein
MFWAVLLIAGLTTLAYAPALRGGFVFDDDNLVTKNALIKADDGLARLWFSSEPVDYWPVTMTSFWVEWRLWGSDPTGYHVDNLLLHIGNALLVWLILLRLGVPGAYGAALLFAVHPVNVQSVAWIAQRKNTLSMLFFLVSIYGFLRTKWGGAEKSSPAAYGLSLLAFVLAMLSKGSVAVLPLVLLGLVAWRRRLRLGDFLRAAPYLAVAAVLTLVNIGFQNKGLAAPIRSAGVVERLLEAGAVPWFYLGKALLPVGLIFVYPLWRVSVADLFWWGPLLAAVGLTGVLWWKGSAARLRPLGGGYAVANSGGAGIWRGVLFAWAYFCVALVPVMGLTDINYMKYSLVADHYQYLALIGVVALAAAGWEKLFAARRRPAGPGYAVANSGGAGIWGLAVVVLLAVLTWRQARIYADAETLYRVTLARNPQCWLADNNLGIVEVNTGRPAEARAHFLRALELNPDYAEAHFNLGLLLRREPGGAAAAAAQFGRATELTPRYPEAHYYLANSLGDLGRTAEAIGQYEQALRWRPNYPEAELNLGTTLAGAGRVAEALPHFAEAVRLDPRSAPAQLNLAYALRELGRVQEGQLHYQEAIRLDPRMGR